VVGDRRGRQACLAEFDVETFFVPDYVNLPRPSREQIYERLERASNDLDTMGGLPSVEEARTIWEGIWEQEAHHSTAIEGNTLLQREVQLLLFEGRAVGSRELREYLEVQGYADAALWVYGQALRRGLQHARDVSLTEVREIHRLVVAPVWLHFPPEHLRPKEAPGAFRRSDIEPLRPGLRPPDWTQVHALVTDWLERANDEAIGGRGRHAAEDFAELHAEFERIHPFPDGNGRVGRLVLNLLLVRYGYPPAVIRKQDRGRYLEGLRRADQGDPGLLAELLARSVKHGVDQFLIPGLAGPHRYVPLSALANMGLSQNALTLAAQRGRLQAAQRNGQWYSSRKHVDEYKQSRYKRPRNL
jgi:hypothetical protein